MTAHQAFHPVAVMCRTLGVSPSGYYAWRKRPLSIRARTDVKLSAEIAAIHRESFLYLAVVVDAWSRRVVGWAMETHLRAARRLRDPRASAHVPAQLRDRAARARGRHPGHSRSAGSRVGGDHGDLHARQRRTSAPRRAATRNAGGHKEVLLSPRREISSKRHGSGEEIKKRAGEGL